jgi:hypothetical protein
MLHFAEVQRLERKPIMRHWHIASLVAVVVLLLTTSATLAGGKGAFTDTIHIQDVTETAPEVNPCTGDPGMATSTVSGVIHLTLLANGTYHITGTFRGTFEFVPDDPTLPTYTGRFTQWFGENSNNQNFAATFTFTLHGTGTDGSKLKFHETAHFSVSATGVLVTFDKLRCA